MAIEHETISIRIPRSLLCRLEQLRDQYARVDPLRPPPSRNRWLVHLLAEHAEFLSSPEYLINPHPPVADQGLRAVQSPRRRVRRPDQHAEQTANGAA